MNKCAFCIPIYPLHYKFGNHILESLKDSDADLYFIFTTVEEKNLFCDMYRDYDYFKYLILKDFTSLDIVEKTRSFVSIKKLYSLLSLYNKYEYISCIDSEINFLINKNFYNMMKDLVDQKTIFGGKILDHMSEENIIKQSIYQLTPPEDHQKLYELSCKNKVYTWWSNIPVYDCKIAKQFLDWINFKFDTLHRFDWHVFDDFIYNYYCLLYHNYKLNILDDVHHSLEFANSVVYEKLNKIYWVNKKAYLQNPSYYHSNNYYIIYHVDRSYFPDFNKSYSSV